MFRGLGPLDLPSCGFEIVTEPGDNRFDLACRWWFVSKDKPAARLEQAADGFQCCIRVDPEQIDIDGEGDVETVGAGTEVFDRGVNQP